MSIPVIQISSLSRRFGEVYAVSDLTLDVQAGEIFGFLGHNGAGKTTTVRLLNGVLERTSGNVTVLGQDPQIQGPSVRAQTGVLTETPSLDERLTARENLYFYAELYGVPRADVNGRIDLMLAEFELALHLNALTFDKLAMDFDAHARRARFRLTTGQSETLSFRIDSDVEFKSGYARVNARVALGLAGRSFALELPQFDLVPRSFDGERYVEIRLPLIYTRF